YSYLLGTLIAALLAAWGIGSTWAQDSRPSGPAATNSGTIGQKPRVGHKVAIQVNDNDARVMNLALNNANNIIEHYKAQGTSVTIEIVAYGPGLHMLRSDTSPVKSRIAEMSLRVPLLSFVACANTQTNMSKQEGKDVPPLVEA
ncbi:unnamed protein product, partial [Phaeothamnion confervicola]